MHRKHRFFSLLLVAAPLLVACDQTSVGPTEQIPSELGVVPDAELAISVDADLTAAAVESTELALGPQRGPGPRARIKNAREEYEHARRRYAAGDPAGARAAGTRARRELSDALIEGLGSAEVHAMIAEAEGVLATLQVDASSVSDAGGLTATLAGLVDAAKVDTAQGRDGDAGEKMVRARQHVDRARKDWARDVDRPNDVLTRDVLARLQVAQGAKAIELAWRLIGDAPNELQVRLMDTAAELQRKAEAALAEGQLGRAASLAHSAEVTALRAVVAARDVNHASVQAVAHLTEQLLEEARVVVGNGGSAVDLALLEVAHRLFDGGLAKLAEGNIRGVVLLWHSATISAVLIG